MTADHASDIDFRNGGLALAGGGRGQSAEYRIAAVVRAPLIYVAGRIFGDAHRGDRAYAKVTGDFG